MSLIGELSVLYSPIFIPVHLSLICNFLPYWHLLHFKYRVATHIISHLNFVSPTLTHTWLILKSPVHYRYSRQHLYIGSQMVTKIYQCSIIEVLPYQCFRWLSNAGADMECQFDTMNTACISACMIACILLVLMQIVICNTIISVM